MFKRIIKDKEESYKDSFFYFGHAKKTWAFIERIGIFNALYYFNTVSLIFGVQAIYNLEMEERQMKESKFQSNLIKKIKNTFEGCIVMKTDPNYIQGLPDILILYKDKWAALECKKSSKAHHQPNQSYFVDIMNKMSFSRFIYPENEKGSIPALNPTFFIKGNCMFR